MSKKIIYDTQIDNIQDIKMRITINNRHVLGLTNDGEYVYGVIDDRRTAAVNGLHAVMFNKKWRPIPEIIDMDGYGSDMESYNIDRFLGYLGLDRIIGPAMMYTIEQLVRDCIEGSSTDWFPKGNDIRIDGDTLHVDKREYRLPNTKRGLSSFIPFVYFTNTDGV